MNDPEFHLKSARLAPPSESLDRRMHDAFREASAKKMTEPKRQTWPWLTVCAATGLAAALILVFTRSSQPPISKHFAAVTTTYRIESPGALQPLLLKSPVSPRPLPEFTVSISTP